MPIFAYFLSFCLDVDIVGTSVWETQIMLYFMYILKKNILLPNTCYFSCKPSKI